MANKCTASILCLCILKAYFTTLVLVLVHCTLPYFSTGIFRHTYFSDWFIITHLRSDPVPRPGWGGHRTVYNGL